MNQGRREKREERKERRNTIKLFLEWQTAHSINERKKEGYKKVSTKKLNPKKKYT